MNPALTGFLLGGSLILAIGAQNAFVLRQGLLRRHVFPVCLLCSLSDLVLIAAGVAGFGALTAALPWLPAAMTLGGAAFLAAYGAMRLRAAWRGDYALVLAGVSAPLGATLWTAAALTWLNPHVYLDTLGLMGAVSLQFGTALERVEFVAGAASASFLFFFALGYGARALAPVMRSAAAWRVLDVVVGGTMWALAAGLLLAL